jgi:hypothetical protein
MNNMKQTLLVIGSAVLLLAACKKQDIQSGKITKPDAATETTGLASANCSGVITTPLFGKAYLANYNTQGLCTSPPILNYNGNLDFMTPTNGSAQATARRNCYLTGMAQHPFSCALYYAEGTSSQGYSTLSYMDGAGCITFVADIKDVAGNVLYIDELEFKNDNGDLYLLKKGDYQYLYVISSADVLDGNNVVTAVRMASPMFSNNITKRLSITRFGVSIRLVAEVPALNPVTTVYTVNSNGTLTGLASYNVPNVGSNNISTYYYNNNLYLLRNNANTGSGTLYQLNVTAPTVVPTAGTVVVNNVHDMTFGGICIL